MSDEFDQQARRNLTGGEPLPSVEVVVSAESVEKHFEQRTKDKASTLEAPGIDYFSDLPKQEDVPVATIERIAALAFEANELQATIRDDEVALQELKAKLDRITRTLLPNVMEELGMSEFKLTDGSTVAIAPKLQASITQDNKPAAFAWLRDHNFDGIIKTKVIAEFGKGEGEQAEKVAALIAEAGFDAAKEDSVHPSTLKSFVKERLEAGDSDLPKDVFGVFEFKQAEIKLPKKKK